ncbi:MAG: iron-containing alcohol dehydrogenase [Chloroflexi bacterium]|nr:iron-containing alcohol dehydrogenase [Chloroflexota bacterium]
MAVRRLFVPKEVFYGWGAVESLRQWPGKRAFLVTDKIMSSSGHAEKVLKPLRESGYQVQMFDEVEPEPSHATIRRSADRALEFQPDVILGLGGGSCMDAGKLTWLFYENPQLKEMELPQLREEARRYPLHKKASYVAIPSTSGTGSECTPVAVVGLHTEKMPIKVIILNLSMFPDVAISDAQFPSTMPPSITADTGLDALVHALECYITNRPSDFVDALAIKAFQTIYRWLPKSVHNGQDKEARERVHTAATMAGIAISNGTLGLIHDMAHQLGSAFHIAHGRSCSLMLDAGLLFYLDRAGERFIEAAEIIGLRPKDARDAAAKLLAALRDLRKDIGIPITMQQAGVKEKDFMDLLEVMATNTRTLPLRPLKETQEQVKDLFMKSWRGETL